MVFSYEKSPTFKLTPCWIWDLDERKKKMIARLVNDDDVKLPHGFHEAKDTEGGLGSLGFSVNLYGLY